MIKNMNWIWDEENHKATCIITNEKGKDFFGVAFCHPDDLDMESPKTGQEIAFYRAKIEYLRDLRDSDLKPRLAALKQLYYSMKHSKQFQPKSYENRMLQRQIRLIKFDLDTTNEIIAVEQQRLKRYIGEKDKFYHSIRRQRSGQK